MAKPPDFAVDAELVRALAALLDETGLSEIEYAVGERRIRVARDRAPGAVVVQQAAAPAAPDTAARETRGAVKSPMVGTAYLAVEPGAPPFVQVGDQVQAGQVLLLIEAMKVMNQIPAPAPGRVAAILIADGAPVEYGQVLLVLD